MESLDLQVLRTARHWRANGHAVRLMTVIQTWGSAPRLPGAMVAIRGDGLVAGSVSGGCVEDDLVKRVRAAAAAGPATIAPGMLTYGVTREDAARHGLPCGGTLQLVHETVQSTAWIDELLAIVTAHGHVCRRLDMVTGAVTLSGVPDGATLAKPRLDDDALLTWHGPRWRLLMIGAGQLSQLLASMAQVMDYEVLVCDPREEYANAWNVPGTRYMAGMPDDVVLEIKADSHTAIVALTHDPKLDDMALLEALKSPAFYVGALGSRRNSERRRERLALFDLTARQIASLHGPVGLAIGSRQPAEIAVSILAHLTAVKNAAYSPHPPEPIVSCP